MFDPPRYSTRPDVPPAPDATPFERYLFFDWAPKPPSPLKKHSGEARFRNVDRADYSSPPAGRPAENNDINLLMILLILMIYYYYYY